RCAEWSGVAGQTCRRGSWRSRFLEQGTGDYVCQVSREEGRAGASASASARWGDSDGMDVWEGSAQDARVMGNRVELAAGDGWLTRPAPAGAGHASRGATTTPKDFRQACTSRA